MVYHEDLPPEVSRLLGALLQLGVDEHMSIEQALKHPCFWGPDDILDFITVMCSLMDMPNFQVLLQHAAQESFSLNCLQ